MKLGKTKDAAPAPKHLKVGTKQTVETPLKKLDLALTRLLEFEEKHEKVFTTHRELLEAVAVAENEVKVAAKENKSSAESSLWKVAYTPAKHRWYDADELATLLQKYKAVKSREELFELGVLSQSVSVDEKKLKQLLTLKELDPEKVKPAHHEEDAAPRVTLTKKV